ncbi:hypothetical protein [Sphingobacterium sp. LRF_L2]|uniref:hypothetical protein n=1 Tax=Sphingobacterium sp. LRF_L2 TaxID=3369421 RepID=UPI003F6301BB
MNYQTTQYGWKTTALTALVLLIFIVSYVRGYGNNPIDTPGFIVLGSILLLVLLSFYRLRVVVSDQTIRLIYGIGLICIRIKPSDIIEVHEVRTSWISGWGIRFTSDGMLYNIQGNQAVRIRYGKEKKKTVRIGTSNPEALSQAIKNEFSIAS